MSSVDCYRRSTCRLCGSKDLERVLSLAATPPANALLKASELGQAEERFPLDVFFCRECTHAQLLDVVNPEILFRNYVYVSGTSPVFREHFRQLADLLMRDFKLGAKDRVLEIGSNDGTLLRFFKEKGVDVLGVDPALKIAEESTRNGIPTLPLFFDERQGQKISQEHGQVSAVLANNVYAHIDDLDSVTRGIKSLLLPHGVFVFEVSYLVDVLQKTLFDTIYHEHLCYHSVVPLRKFFEKHGMELFHVERVDSHGGSLRGFVQLAKGPHAVRPSVDELIRLEREQGLHLPETFRKFSDKIRNLGKRLRELVVDLRRSGKKVAGFGSPAKATTLMHQFKLDQEMIDFIVDESPWKQGLYSPGYHVPIQPASAILEKKPDYMVVLAWNFADSIIQKNDPYLKSGGRFIVPLPELKVV